MNIRSQIDEEKRLSCKGQGDFETRFFLACDFGYDITSPIPSVEESHHNNHGVVPAVPGTAVGIFSNNPGMQAEFGDFILDDKGEPCGIECNILRYPRRMQEKFEGLGIPCVMFSLSLMLDQKNTTIPAITKTAKEPTHTIH